MASFLQRKGRAGRDRAMRPITLTVLSDYGRDRAFYQTYEHLFDPTLEPQHLPIRNSYVLKIQAVLRPCSIGWLRGRRATKRAWQWDMLSQTAGTVAAEQSAYRYRSGPRPSSAELVRGDVATIEDLRCSPSLGTRCRRDSQQRRCSGNLRARCWSRPCQRLSGASFDNGNWHFQKPKEILDFQINYHPLPDFVPRHSFRRP